MEKDIDSVFSDAVSFCSPSSVTILPTYKCTAACKECCFESSPKIKERLSRQELFYVVDKIITDLENVKVIVFSGGECFTLGDDLFDILKYIKSKNSSMHTRCVSNGYWGKSFKKAKKITDKLIDSGLSEINFSTGLDHQKFVPLDSVMNSALACIQKGINTLVTIESDTPSSKCLENFIQHDYFLELSGNCKFTYQVNSWMPFHDSSTPRKKDLKKSDIDKGCDQLMENMVVTPHGRLSACCGLTFEHMPEMIIGDITDDNYSDTYSNQLDDILKLWIKTHGPFHILKEVYGDDSEISEKLNDIQHQCHACVLLHKKDREQRKIGDFLTNSEVVPEVLSKINIRSVIQKLQAINQY